MSKFKGFRRRGQAQAKSARCTSAAPAREAVDSLPAAYADTDAQARVMQKIRDLGAAFFDMPADQYGAWVDALSRDEFIEYVALATH